MCKPNHLSLVFSLFFLFPLTPYHHFKDIDEFLASNLTLAQSLLDPSRLSAAIEQAERAGASADALAGARAQVEAIEAERVRLLAHPVMIPFSLSFRFLLNRFNSNDSPTSC